MKLSTIWITVGLSALSTAACLGGPEEEETTGEELVVFAGGQQAIASYGRTLLANPEVDCSAATGFGGVVPILQLSSGQYAAVAGVVARADDTVTIQGASAAHTGDAGIALGAAGLWDGASLQFGGALVGQYVVPMGSAMPQTEQEANELFDEAFGPNARGGASLSTKRQGGWFRPRVIAWYTIGDAVLPGPDGGAYRYAMGIVQTEGQVLAVHTTGFGSWQSYVE